MGSSRTKKAKRQDFQKAKLKLGKGKQKAANATDVSYTSRSIALGQQSIGRERSDVPTTKRGLSLEDLQSHLKHYNANTRKDAFSGLRELLTAYPDLTFSSISTLLPLLARLVGDEDVSVRKSLLAFLEWYLPSIPTLTLQPYHSILIFFTTSALSHIYPDVRMDAVRVLNLLLDSCAEGMMLDWRDATASTSSSKSSHDNHPQRVLECYLALLHVRSGVTTNGLRTDMSAISKALILSSLAKYLHSSLAPEGHLSAEQRQEQASPEVPTWLFAGSLATSRAFIGLRGGEAEDSADTKHTWTASDVERGPEGFNMENPHSQDHLGLSSIQEAASELLQPSAVGQSSEALPSSAEALLSTLLPILVAAFLDSAPTAFSPSAAAAPAAPAASTSSASINAPLETVVAVTVIARDLWRSILAKYAQRGGMPGHLADTAKSLEKFAAHMAAYFPFGAHELSKRTTEAEGKLQNLNIAYCELISLLYLNATTPRSSGSMQESGGYPARDYGNPPSAKLETQLGHVRTYVGTLLAGANAIIASPLGVHLDPHMYIDLLPTIWSLLLAAPRDAENSTLVLLLRHFMGLSASSGVKKVALSFILKIIYLQASREYTQAFSLRLLARRPEVRQLMDDWLLSLSRYVWELGTNDPETSQLLLEYLQYVAVDDSLTPGTRDKLLQYLIPYFSSFHPSKGFVKGPWTKLRDEQELQRTALVMAWWLTRAPVTNAVGKLVDAVSHAVDCVLDDSLSDVWHSLQYTELS